MDDATAAHPPAVLAMKARVPEHVVHRQFAKETVILNLQTGLYHGLNATGGRMMEVLDRAPTVEVAAAELAQEYTVPLDAMQHEVADFCASLAERNLLVLEPAA